MRAGMRLFYGRPGLREGLRDRAYFDRGQALCQIASQFFADIVDREHARVDECDFIGVHVDAHRIVDDDGAACARYPHFAALRFVELRIGS